MINRHIRAVLFVDDIATDKMKVTRFEIPVPDGATTLSYFFGTDEMVKSGDVETIKLGKGA